MKKIIFLIILLLTGLNLYATPSFDVQTTGSGTASGSGTVAHTCGASSNFLTMELGIQNSTITATNVQYNGVEMLEYNDCWNTSNGILYLYYLVNPGTGSAYNTTFTLSSNTTWGAIVDSWIGIDSIGASNFATQAAVLNAITAIEAAKVGH